MTLKIISAEKVEYTGEVEAVTMPGVQGLFTVLDHHAAMISALAAGKLLYGAVNGEKESRDIKGGIVDINNNVVSVCIY